MEFHEYNGQGDAMGKGDLALRLIYNNHAALANKDIVNYPYEAYKDQAPEAWNADKRYFRDTIGTLPKYDYY